MRKQLLIVGALVLGLAACGGEQAVVQDQAVPAGGDVSTVETGGVDAAAGVQPEAVGSSDALSQTRVMFEFDSSAISSEGAAIVEAHAARLAADPALSVTLEGHCDERGTREYNLALGERRAKAVARMMKVLGVSSDRIKVTSYGEERPLDPGHGESAWGQNRRVEILY